MPKLPTLEELRSWSPEKRLRLYQNAQKHPDGKPIVEMIDQSGLSLSSGGLTNDDPVVIQMIEIIWSNEGREAALEATRKGLPAVSGIDPLLQAALGDRYHKHNQGTMNAGFYVAELMRHLGYKAAGKAPCSPDCIAKTGETWVPKG